LSFYSESLMDEIAEIGTIDNFGEIPDEIKRLFPTAHNISPEWHIRMQGAFQEYVDNAVSKTVNFPNSATPEDIKTTYTLAYELGCKGVTVYRDGSREEQVLSVGTKAQDGGPEFHYISPRTRPNEISGVTRKLKTGCDNLYVTINDDEFGPFELFSQMGHGGGCAAAQSEAIARLVSLSLRSGIDPEVIIKHLNGIRCPNPQMGIGGTIHSCPDAIAKALEYHVKKTMKDVPEKSHPDSSTLDQYLPKEGNGTVVGMCPEKGCTGVLIHVEGCDKCMVCGYSKCS